MKRIITTTLAAIVGGTIAVAGTASAHTATIDVSCASIAVTARYYPPETTYTVSIDDGIIEAGSFDGSLDGSWDNPDQTEPHIWHVAIDSPDGDAFDLDEYRQVEACQEPTSTTTTTSTTVAASTTTSVAPTTTAAGSTTTAAPTAASTTTTAASTTTAPTAATTTTLGGVTPSSATPTPPPAAGSGVVPTMPTPTGTLPATGRSSFLIALIALGFVLAGVVPTYWAWWRRRNGYARES